MFAMERLPLFLERNRLGKQMFGDLPSRSCLSAKCVGRCFLLSFSNTRELIICMSGLESENLHPSQQ